MLIQMVLCSVIHVLQLFKITSDIINLSIFKAKKSIALDPEIFGQDAGSGRLRELILELCTVLVELDSVNLAQAGQSVWFCP